MQTAEFTVDTPSVFRQCSNELAVQGPAAWGLRFGLAEIYRHIAAIAERAIELDDEVLLQHLRAMCVVTEKDAK